MRLRQSWLISGAALAVCALALASEGVAQPAPAAPLPLPRAEMWMLLPLFEANRPVIVERKLSGAEKSEARNLSRAYLDYHNMSATRTMAALARMRKLASSGDKDAMIAIREALQKGYAPLDYIAKFDLQDKDSWFFKYLAQVQAAQWTAQIWSRYGYEDAGRESINVCVGGMYGVYNHKDGVTVFAREGRIIPVTREGTTPDSALDTCGFELTGGPAFMKDKDGYSRKIAPKGVTLIPAYGSNGWGGFDHGGGIYITGVTFGPIYGDKDFLEAKFQRHVEARRKGLLYDLSGHERTGPVTATMMMSLPWYERYAIDNDKIAQLQAADTEIAEKVYADKKAEQKMWAQVFADAKAHAGGISDEKAYYDMHMAAMKLGGDYEKEFEKVPKPESLARFDSIGAGSSSAGGGSSDPNARVEIRSYDSTGNYTGSVMTSPFWASVINMTSASH